jgi:hypothetical protein
MKKALYYAIRSAHYSPKVIAITSIKGQHWYGRETRHDTATHGRLGDDINGKFETLEAAQAKVEAIARVERHHAPLIEAAQLQLTRANEAKRRSIIDALDQ